MAKEIKAQVKLQIPAGAANPAPPVGPALGQHGVQIMEFCKQFNERTKKFEAGMVIPAVIKNLAYSFQASGTDRQAFSADIALPVSRRCFCGERSRAAVDDAAAVSAPVTNW